MSDLSDKLVRLRWVAVVFRQDHRKENSSLLCAHGDNIPWLLDELGIDWNGKCKKGSIWMIQRDGRGAVKEAKYVKVEVEE